MHREDRVVVGLVSRLSFNSLFCSCYLFYDYYGRAFLSLCCFVHSYQRFMK